MRKPRNPLRVLPVAMDEEFLAEVLDELDRTKSTAPHERRKFERITYRSIRAVLMVSEWGRDAAFMVATRNISQGGVCILHRQMLYPSEKCSLVFPMVADKHLLVQGRIIRCRHIRGVLHEVGVRFARPISPQDVDSVVKVGEAVPVA